MSAKATAAGLARAVGDHGRRSPPGETASVGARIARGRAALAAGDAATATRLAEEILAARPREVAALHLLGSVAARSGRHDTAHDLFHLAATIVPEEAELQFDLGRALQETGQHDAAADRFRRALVLTPTYPAAHLCLAMAMLPGENYLDLMRRAHRVLRPTLYLEIGVGVGMSLALARPPTRAIGVDPNPRASQSLDAITTVHHVTSDVFFASLADEVLGGRPIPMAFIDGMHTFDQALRDFANVERRSSSRTIAFIHDCIPLSAATATRTRNTPFWSGDTWKIVLALKRYRPDLTVRTIATGPTGLAVVTGLDATSRVIDARWSEIVANIMPVRFEDVARDRAAMLNIVPNDPLAFEAMLRDVLHCPPDSKSRVADKAAPAIG